MATQAEARELIERYKDFRLVNISKVCPNCDRGHYMEFLGAEIPCSCGRIVTFTPAEKWYILQDNIIPFLQAQGGDGRAI